jgi:hypothetical protein
VRHWLKGQGVDLENGMKESESNQEADLSHTVVPATSRSAQIENGIENPEETICKAVDDDDVQDSQEIKCTGDAEIALKECYAHSATRDVAEIRSDRAEDHSNVGDNGSDNGSSIPPLNGSLIAPLNGSTEVFFILIDFLLLFGVDVVGATATGTGLFGCKG